MEAGNKTKVPEDWDVTVPGRYLARIIEGKPGIWKDEIRKYPNGQKTLVVYPYTKHRANKQKFREISVGEFEVYHKTLFGAGTKEPYEVIQRKLEDMIVKDKARIEAVRKKKLQIELEKEKKEAAEAERKKMQVQVKPAALEKKKG